MSRREAHVRDSGGLPDGELTTNRLAVVALLAVATLEIAFNRVAIGSKADPGLAQALLPATGTPPFWYTQLSYLGLFLFYFVGTLAAGLIGARCIAAFRRRRDRRELVAHAALAVAAVLAALPLVVATPDWLTLPLELAFAITVVAMVVSAFGRDRDRGVQIGSAIVAIPLLLHTLFVVGGRWLWDDSMFDGPGVALTKAGPVAIALVALVSPYALSARPFARAVVKVAPIVVAMSVAAGGALLARLWYPQFARAANLAIGVTLDPAQADPRLAIDMLAIATLAWTLASCATSSSQARRTIGAGLALVVLGGYGFRWASYDLLALFGFALIADGARRVRDEELEALPLTSDTPAIADTAWSTYVTAVTTALRGVLQDVHSLTTRAEGGMTSSVFVGDTDKLTVTTRIERIEGSVIALDVVLGREIDEVRGATLTLWAVPPRGRGPNPAGPPAAPLFKTGDISFDERFKARGNALVFAKLFDAGLRERAEATLDGWLAFWEPEGMRFRVYPGRGAQLDHPIPLSDLALGRPATADRLVAVVALLVDIAKRGVVAPSVPEPQALEALADEVP